MNERSLLNTYINKYIDFNDVNGVVPPSAFMNVTVVTASASSYTFDINKNYKWTPTSGAKTINATSYSGYIHGKTEIYVDLSSGATLSFGSGITTNGDIIDNGINRITLEWWGSSVTAYINYSSGSGDSGDSQQVSYVATGCTTAGVNGTYTVSIYTWDNDVVYVNENNYYLLHNGSNWEIWYGAPEAHAMPNWYNQTIVGTWGTNNGDTPPTFAEASAAGGGGEGATIDLDNIELTVLAKAHFDSGNEVCFEGCGNYFDTGYTKGSQKVYSNGAYSLFYSGINWRIAKGVPDANNYSFSLSSIIDDSLTTNISGDYEYGSKVTLFDHSFAPIVSGGTISKSLVLNTAIDINFAYYANSYYPSAQMEKGASFVFTNEPYYGEPAYLSAVNMPPGVSAYIDSSTYDYIKLSGTPTTSGSYTSIISAWFNSHKQYNYYQTSIKPGVLTAYFSVGEAEAPSAVWVIGTQTSDSNAGYNLGGKYTKVDGTMRNNRAVYYNSAKNKYLYVCNSLDGYYAWIFWSNLNKYNLEESYLFSEDLYNTVRTNTTNTNQPVSPVGLQYMNESDWWSGLTQDQFCVTDEAQAEPSDLIYNVTNNSNANGTYVYYNSNGYGGTPTYYCAAKSKYIYKADCDGERRCWCIGSSIMTLYGDYSPWSVDAYIGDEGDTPPVGNWGSATVTLA